MQASDGRRHSADAELWHPCWPDVARGNMGGVGSLALPAGARPYRQGTETLEGDLIAALERQDLTGIGRGRDF
jgi:hypothetical protein